MAITDKYELMLTKLSVLLVEDEPQYISIVKRSLERETAPRFKLHSVSSMTEALKYLGNQTPDLILLDLGLPDCQGIDTLHSISEVAGGTPIVVFSGHQDDLLALQTVKHGAQDYLVKGYFDSKLLIRVMRHAIERQHLRLELEQSTLKVAASEKRFRTIIEKNIDGIIILDKEGKIQFTNVAAQDIFGRSANGLKNSVFGCPVISETRSIEIGILRKDGQRIDAEMRLVEIEWRNAECLLATLRDITARKAAENRAILTAKILEVLNRSQQHREIISMVLLLINKFIGVNAIGIRLQQGDDFPFYETFGFSADFVASEQFLCKRKQNQVVFDKNGKPVLECMCGHIIRSQIDNSLSCYTEYGSFWTNNLSALIASDFCKNQLPKTRNRCFHEGYESLAIIPLRTDKTTIGLLQLNDKRKNIFSLALVEFFERLGASIGIAVARKRAEQELETTNIRLQEALQRLKKAHQQTIQQERLRALGQMASGIVHDFNNALMSISGFSELLLNFPQRLENREKSLHYIKMIYTSSQDAANVVRRLREFYRAREKNEFSPSIQVNTIIKQVLEITKPKWKDQAQAKGLSIDIATDLRKVPFTHANESELREMLTNLIFNAVDAMPKGGLITICTCQQDDKIKIEISDSGVGMDEITQNLCLEPFYTTKGEEGTGLGLASVYGIIQRHMGTIEIDSKLNCGTTFTIYLPTGRTEQNLETIPAAHSSQAPHLRILAVDDEAQVRTFLRDCLGVDGHHIETADNGYHALEKFRCDNFQLVITDRAMPGISGDELVKHIKQINSQVPIIMLTGFGEMMLATDEKPQGVDVILGKPISVNELRNAVAGFASPSAPLPEI